MTIYAETQIGMGKSQCDDRILIDNTILCEAHILLKNVSPKIIGIADGVGGNRGGNEAAHFICEKLSGIPHNDLTESVASINSSLLDFAAASIGKEHMASTFSGIVFGETNQLIHIGNTRIYSFQGSYLKQITADQTTYNRLTLMGLADEAEACNKSEIISCFGGGSAVLFKPVISECKINFGFMITSDGIHDHIDIDTMESIVFSSDDLPKISEALFNTAVQNGSHDDMSIVIAYV